MFRVWAGAAYPNDNYRFKFELCVHFHIWGGLNLLIRHVWCLLEGCSIWGGLNRTHFILNFLFGWGGIVILELQLKLTFRWAPCVSMCLQVFVAAQLPFYNGLVKIMLQKKQQNNNNQELVARIGFVGTKRNFEFDLLELKMAELNQNYLEPFQMKPEDCWSCNAHLRPKSDLSNFQAFFSYKHIWPFSKKNEGHPRVTIFAIWFQRFNHVWAWWPSWSCDWQWA